MSDLTFFEKRTLEQLFGMEGGFVLNFTNRTFSDFFHDHNIDIYSNTYNPNNTSSKANLLRAFWKLATNDEVAKTTLNLFHYGIKESCLLPNSRLVADGYAIINRLKNSSTKPELSILEIGENEESFKVFIKEIRASINNNEPENGLDRLHTYVTKYIRKVCKQHGLETSQDEPLHSIFGKYIKYLLKSNLIESEMSVLILKSNISILDKFNDVRNNKSLAHDNALLNRDESTLIFEHIISAMKFIKALEEKLNSNL